MKVSLNWLKELVDIDVKPEELASSLEMVGIGVEGIEEVEDDFIFNLEITPNRPDCLGHIGVAREISAILDKPLRIPEVSYGEEDEETKNLINVEIQAPELCPRYSGIIIRDLKIGPSPEKIRRRLEALGLRAINNAVDITNYSLLLTGHPVHAFDLKKIKDRKIIIRRAEKGESILTLEGTVKVLDERTLVIADNERALAIAGVIGGEESGINDLTTDIFLESAFFNPVSIRRTARRLGISTEASYRFERGVDWDIPIYSVRFCATLFNQTGGKITKGIIDVFPAPIKIEPINLRREKLRELLGLDIPAEKVEGILRKLEFKILSSRKENGTVVWTVLPPSFRVDIREEADLIEEVARFFGYGKVPSTLPKIILDEVYIDPVREKLNSISRLLNFQGWSEVITFSFIDPEEDVSIGKGEPIAIMNPISSRFSRMRRDLLTGILKTISLNLSRNVEGGKIFEIGKVFWKEGAIFERNNLALASFKKPAEKWVKEKEFSILSLNGTVSLLLSSIGYDNHKFVVKEIPIFQHFYSLSIFVNDVEIGWLGKVKEEILRKYSIETDVYYAEICLDTLFGIKTGPQRIQPLPRFPSIRRDISFLISKDIKYAELEEEIRKMEIKELEGFFLWDIFRGGEIPEDKLSMTMGFVFRSLERTLTNLEVNGVMNIIEKALREKFNVQIRGKDV